MRARRRHRAQRRRGWWHEWSSRCRPWRWRGLGHGRRSGRRERQRRHAAARRRRRKSIVEQRLAAGPGRHRAAAKAKAAVVVAGITAAAAGASKRAQQVAVAVVEAEASHWASRCLPSRRASRRHRATRATASAAMQAQAERLACTRVVRPASTHNRRPESAGASSFV